MKIDFDKRIFHPIRLQLLNELLNVDDEWVPFQELKNILELTDGNLASHLRMLKKCGFVEKKKIFKGEYPQTLIRITTEGISSFEKVKQWFHHNFLEG